MSMSSFIVLLVVVVLPLTAALACLVGAIVGGERSRAPGRALGVAVPAAEATSPVHSRRTLRPSRAQPARVARRVARVARPASAARA